MFEALSTVFLIASDLEASRKFYTDTLGLTEASAAGDHVRYEIGGASLVVHGPIPDDEMRAWNLEPVGEPRGSGVVITLRAADVDAAHAALSERGAEVLSAPRDARWGARLFIVRDPDGYLIEISRPL